MKLYKLNNEPTIYINIKGTTILVPIIYRAHAKFIEKESIPYEDNAHNPIKSISTNLTLPSWVYKEAIGSNENINIKPSALSFLIGILERQNYKWGKYEVRSNNYSISLWYAGLPLLRLDYHLDMVSPILLKIHNLNLLPEVAHSSLIKLVRPLLWYFDSKAQPIEESMFQSENKDWYFSLSSAPKTCLYSANKNYNDPDTFLTEAKFVNKKIRENLIAYMEANGVAETFYKPTIKEEDLFVWK